ncbi:uncharacterized protein [Eurosta solidaginis]|uniref:uncharacterized protein n=1 Tax=Eurosta solidaginis TaxID=178769 RepID=UPI00353141D4
MQIKIESLTVAQINKLLRNANISATGNKAHKVAALIQHFESDEIDANEIDQEEPWERPISELRDMITELTRSLQTQNASRPSVEPVTSQETVRESNVQSTTQQASTYKIQDIVGILPEFNPLKKLITAQQFVTKAEQLQRTYLWSDNLLLFAAQQKLVGVAKSWLDAQPVFQSWTDLGTWPTQAKIWRDID